MADYVKSPVVEVKAEQFLVAVKPWPPGVDEDPLSKGAYYFASSSEGALGLSDGDWIVTDEHGRRFVLPPARFGSLYTVKP